MCGGVCGGWQVLESLCLVHGRSIVHTDVKPENILLVDQVHKKGLMLEDGALALEQLKVKLVDFGSAVHRSLSSLPPRVNKKAATHAAIGSGLLKKNQQSDECEHGG